MTPTEAKRAIADALSADALQRWNGLDESTINEYVVIAQRAGVSAAVNSFEDAAALEGDDHE